MSVEQWCEVLGLKKGATNAQIREAYLDLVKIWHPDRFQNDPKLQKKAEEKIKQINSAYAELREYRQAESSVETVPESTAAKSHEPAASQSVDSTPVEIKINPRDGAELVFVPAGNFEMGHKDQADNRPRPIFLKGYWIYKKPVTVEQYRKFVESQDGGQMPERPSWGWIDDHPVVNVNVFDAEQYCKWAGVRLPSEEEWEKAAAWDYKNSRKLIFPWGDMFDPSRLWSSVYGKKRRTNPSGAIDNGASPYGALDMSGNIWEWTSSKYDGSDSMTSGPRVLRGGSWGTIGLSRFCSACRYSNQPDYGSNLIGFRGAMKS